MGGGETLARHVRAQGPEDGRDRRADVRADREREGVVIADLAGDEGRDREHQHRVGGLHHDRHQDPDGRVGEHAQHALEREAREVDVAAQRLEAVLDELDADEEKGDAEQHVSQPLDHLVALVDEQDAEHRHGQRVDREVDLYAVGGHEPGAGRGADVGAENDADPGGQADQPRAEKGDRDQRDQRARLHQGRRDQPEAEAAEPGLRRRAERALEDAAGKRLEPLFQAEHAEHEQRHAGRQLHEVVAQPEAPRQNERDPKQYEFLGLFHADAPPPQTRSSISIAESRVAPARRSRYIEKSGSRRR